MAELAGLLAKMFDRPATTGFVGGRREHTVFGYLERTAPRELEPSLFFSDWDYAAADRSVEQASFLPLMHYLCHS